jgi:hypothetical protein
MLGGVIDLSLEMHWELHMSIPVFIRHSEGQFVATLVGVPEVTVIAPTRDAALTQMQAVLHQQISDGKLVFLDLIPRGFMALAGKYRDDPTLQEICDEIYRQRDLEREEALKENTP